MWYVVESFILRNGMTPTACCAGNMKRPMNTNMAITQKRSPALIDFGLCITALSVQKGWQRALAITGAVLVSLFVSGGNYMPAFFNIMVLVAFAGIGVMKKRYELHIGFRKRLVIG